MSLVGIGQHEKFLSCFKMEDLNDLTLCLKLGEIPSVEMRLNEKFNFFYYVLIQTIEGEITPKHRRFVVINAEILLLDDALITTYSNEKEIETLKQRLEEEQGQLKNELNETTKTRSSTFSSFDNKLSLLMNI